LQKSEISLDTGPPALQLVLSRIYMLETCWLRHNKNPKWLKQLVLGPGVADFKATSRRQSIFWWTRRKS